MKQKDCRSLHLSFSVDWEGENFSGVKDLLRTRDEIEQTMGREIPLTHFICPAYYTGGVSRATGRILSVIRRDIDEIACHVHCWKSIVEESRVKARDEFDWHAGTSRAGSGHGVPFGIYDFEDVLSILKVSKRIVEHEIAGQEVTSFRCGGTMANDTVFRALLDAGFTVDSSAFPPSLVSQGFNPKRPGNRLDGFGEDNGLLTTWKMALWGHSRQEAGHLANTMQYTANSGRAVTCMTQPYRIGNEETRCLVELPITGGISDYVNTSRSVWPVFEKMLKQAKAGRGPLFFHFGCHQEGDLKYKEPFVDFFSRLAKLLFHDRDAARVIRFGTVNEVAGMKNS